MARVTKIRGTGTRANESYDPSGTGLASDAELESRVKLHESMYHHNKNDVLKLYFDDNSNLIDIKTYNNDAEEILLAWSNIAYIDGYISEINRKVFNEEGELYMHLKKTFEFDANYNLTKITNEKVV